MLHPVTPDAFDVEFDIAYARADNVAGRALYRRPACYLHAEAIERLRAAIAIAGGLGLRFRIYDGFRPIESQRALFAAAPDPEFVSNPDTGAVPHCRGAAVDLTLIDDRGDALDMGTAFDAFTARASHGDLSISPAAQRNRALLLGVMTAAGWDFYRKEWWHYQLFAPRRLPVLSDSVLAEPLAVQASTAATDRTSGI